jgi:hypothetical protein
MRGNIKPIDKQALLGDGNGGTDTVYVSPTTGKASTKPSVDSVAVPRTTWWTKSSGEVHTPIFSAPQVRDRLKLEASEMAIYFPDFELFEDGDAAFWMGTIQGIGEVKILYPSTYPAQKFEAVALDQGEAFNDELKNTVWSYDGITPAGAVIVTMRLFLLRKVAEG